MHKIIFAILFFYFTTHRLIAQISPKESSLLNYRLIGFSFPEENTGSKYTIEIAEGYYNNADSFKQNLITSFTSDKNKMTGIVPAFGKQYTWRVTTPDNTTVLKNEFHHFSTMANMVVDTNVTRLRIIKTAEKYKDAFVFMDGTKTLYDMNGMPVWFLPEIEGIPAGLLRLGDMKLTPQGTITFMSGRRNAMIYEVDYNGTVLWQGPGTGTVSGDSTEHYNHAFTRLYNGHYMVLGFESVLWKLPSAVDSSVLTNPNYKDKIVRDGNNIFHQKMFFYTLIEYDEQGKVVWSLRTSKYFKQDDNTLLKTTPRGIYDDDQLLVNSFHFDEKNKIIYLSFRNIGRVLKVRYPDGNLLSMYGNVQQSGIRDEDKDLFCWQHACSHSDNGYIYLFNNNVCHPGKLPKITVIKDPSSEKDTLKKIWEYECTIEGINTEKQNLVFSNGGSIMELPDNSMFGCMSNQSYTKVFIVNRNKEILWSAISEHKDPGNNKWQAVNQYKASIIINREDLEQLIRNTETRADRKKK